MKHRLALAVVGIVLLLAAQVLAPAIAAACSYAPYSPVRTLREADAAFIGTVVEVKEERQLDADGRSYRANYIHRFQVITSWKGVSTPEVTILFQKHVVLDEYGRRNLAPCPEPEAFTPGATYLVYAARDAEGDALVAGYGPGWPNRILQSMADAQTEIRVFGKGKQWIYTEGVGMPKAGRAEPSIDARLALWLVAVGLGLSLLGRYRHRRA